VNSWKVILATMVIFGTGVVTGGLLVHYSEVKHLPRATHAAGAGRPPLLPNPGLVRLDFLRRASRDLNLTPEQHEKADKVIKESQDRTRKVMTPYLREELQRTQAEFREVLTPEQRARFDDLLKQQQQRARDQRRPPAPGERPAEKPAPEPKS
jgi:Spy/CpxP family protein refolding chaperone